MSVLTVSDVEDPSVPMWSRVPVGPSWSDSTAGRQHGSVEEVSTEVLDGPERLFLSGWRVEIRQELPRS